MKTLVMKFGGSSIGTSMGLTQVVSIALQEHERWDRLMIVAAALEGVTDALIEAARLAELTNRRGYRRIAATIRTRHIALIEQLPLGNSERSALQADIDRLLFDMLDICQTMSDPKAEAEIPRKTDAIIGVGERLSARIIAALLRQNNIRGVAIDAEGIIVTRATPGHAVPDMDETCRRINAHLLPMMERDIVPIVTGFIGGTSHGEITTLGRGGSDYTASILAICVQATEVWVWAGVDGMMTTDPREHPDAVVIAAMSYDEVAEIAYFGARILHPRMVAPLRDNAIPLRIKSVFKPQQAGTLVSGVPSSATTIKAVTSIQGLGFQRRQNGSLSEITAVIDQALYDSIGMQAEVMISAQSSLDTFFCVVIPTMAGPDAVHTALNHVNKAFAAYHAERDEAIPWNVFPVSIITLIGTDLNLPSVLSGPGGAVLADIPILALSQGTSRCSISLVVETQYADIALTNLHRHLRATEPQ